jgi:hypothetical protein
MREWRWGSIWIFKGFKIHLRIGFVEKVAINIFYRVKQLNYVIVR